MKSVIKQTTCTMDCPDTCTLDVKVEEGKIKSIKGNKLSPVTNGYICNKVSRFARRVYNKDRILFPMKRTGRKGEGIFERISWDEAIQTIVVNYKKIIKDFGGEAILPYHYGGSNGLLGEEFLDNYFFAKLDASRIGKTLCATPTSIVSSGMYGKMPGVAYPDYRYAKFILIWGANPKVSNIHLMPYLKQAKKNGTFIAVIDPVNNFSDVEIDLHLPVLPGTDLPVTLAMINHWKNNNQINWDFTKRHCTGWEKILEEADKWKPETAAEISGINATDIIKLAEIYAKSNPALLRCGWGIERNRNGGQSVAAVLAMPALLGKFGVRGGGYTMSNNGTVKFNAEKIFGDFKWNARILNMTQLGDILTKEYQPPIKSLFVYNCNPVATVPDQNRIIGGLKKEDLFTVVHEQVMTDTAKYADIILPAVTFLEQYEIKKSYGNYMLGNVKPVIKARGESKSNEEVFSLLGKAMNLGDDVFQWDTKVLIDKMIDSFNIPDKNELKEKNNLNVNFKGNTPVQFVNVFPGTKNEKINLCPTELGKNAYKFKKLNDKKCPLYMISPATNKMVNSILGEFNYPELIAAMNIEDAKSRKIKSGDVVRIYNDLGEVICKVQLSQKIRPGVVFVPKGAWQKSSLNRRTSVALCPATVSDVGGGACYSDARVEIAKYNIKE